MDVQIKDRPELRCACVKHEGADNRISGAFAQLGRELRDIPLG